MLREAAATELHVRIFAARPPPARDRVPRPDGTPAAGSTSRRPTRGLRPRWWQRAGS